MPIYYPLVTGCAGAKEDPKGRTLNLASIFEALPPIPEVYSVDSQFTFNMLTPMYGNDTHGDCVIVARAHHTLRFEGSEQGRYLSELTTKNVLDEWHRENGSTENGLYLLDSLKSWRSDGWNVGGTATAKKQCFLCKWLKPAPPVPPTGRLYNIYAFGKVDPLNHDHVKTVIYLLNGAYIGLALPKSAQSQLVWDVVGNPDTDPDSKKWSWGGHCVYVMGYDADGLICISWGRKVRMTWAFFDTYCFEAYGVVDNRDNWLDSSIVNTDKLDSYLKEVAS